MNTVTWTLNARFCDVLWYNYEGRSLEGMTDELRKNGIFRVHHPFRIDADRYGKNLKYHILGGPSREQVTNDYKRSERVLGTIQRPWLRHGFPLGAKRFPHQ